MYNEAMELQTFIFIGRSGCGKGTQVTLLQEHFKKQDHKRHIFYIETGERFRQFIRSIVYLVGWPLKFIGLGVASLILLPCGCGHTFLSRR